MTVKSAAEAKSPSHLPASRPPKVRLLPKVLSVYAAPPPAHVPVGHGHSHPVQPAPPIAVPVDAVAVPIISPASARPGTPFPGDRVPVGRGQIKK